MNARRIAIASGILLFLIVLLQNLRDVSVSLLFWEAEIPIFVLILLSMIVGAGGGWIAHMMRSRRISKKTRTKAEKVEQSETPKQLTETEPLKVEETPAESPANKDE